MHGLAAQLGGAMTIQSRRGFGRTVELWLPIAMAQAPESEKSEPAVEAVGAGAVLLVDNEELVRASTAVMLKTREWRPTCHD